jgi:hypothetical protein
MIRFVNILMRACIHHHHRHHVCSGQAFQGIATDGGANIFIGKYGQAAN